jgi:hypothetical protein
MNMNKYTYKLLSVLIVISVLLTACTSTAVFAGQITEERFSGESSSSIEQVDSDESIAEEEIQRPEGWSDETHDNSTDPNYDVVFPQEEINEITITITPENWEMMWADMTELYGEFGAQQDRGMEGMQQGNRPGMQPSVDEGNGQQENRPVPGEGRQMPGGADMPMEMEENPIWITATIEFEGNTWENVGFRLKGNSSLRSSWGSGNLKMPFKLDFDEFEDDYPEVDDQRFYGFKQLTFANNFQDASLIREKVTADLFREAGLASANTAFYAVYVDYGNGPEYFGLYTAVEVIDDTVIETQFDDDSGNVYKPSGTGASFAEGTFSEAVFDKETNTDEADYSDIQAVFQALHDDTRLTDAALWRANLEAVFDVDTFITWLAANTVIQNWDTYGVMEHNYYLYTDPTTGLVTWIPWDNNMSLSSNNGMKSVLSLDLTSVGENWPLIRYLMDDPVYHDHYVAAVETFVSEVFVPEELVETYDELHDLIQPYVTGSQGEQAGYTFLNSPAQFDQAFASLVTHAYDRYQAAWTYIRSEK